MNSKDIRPKLNNNNNDSNDFIISRIHVSKNWKLPPLMTNSRGNKRQQATTTNNNETKTNLNETELLLLKKQRQNRDAQRAYRERKEKRLKEMEVIIDDLQNKVKYWQRLYQSKSNELIHLENKFNQIITQNNNNDINDIDNLIDNFKPLKSVPLLPSLTTTTTTKKLTPLRPMPSLPKSSLPKTHKCSNPKHNHSNDNNTTPSNCGFCDDDSTSCICNELTTTTNTVPKPMPPMTIAQLTCSSDPHTCTKCSDINQTCIKPTDNNNKNNIPDEIDFTNYK